MGKRIYFYHTSNFVEWEKTGEFTPGDYGYEGICECPDCIRFMTEEGEKYVLIISMIIPDERIDGSLYYRMTHVSQYYVGEFDGRTFIDTQKSKHPLIVDYGTDNYAMVTFANMQSKVLLGWKENWDYAQTTPSLSQAQRIKKLSQDGLCTFEAMCAVMDEEKKPEQDHVTIKNDVLRKYFPKDATPRQMEDQIIKLLDQWQKKKQRMECL